MSESTLETIREIMIDVFDLDDDFELTADTSADDIDEWDSLSHIRLVVAVERQFGIKFKNSEIEGLKNVGELVAVIDGKLG
ncbi:acyl carrier protein [Sphingomonas zeicaulis]|uniref:acyl carrier protein n=1 Tax=Sphingomonas zeicaulis TaxID=1632740 RepID=UPI003D1D1BCB